MAGIIELLSILPKEISSNDDEYIRLKGTPKPVKCRFCGRTLFYDGMLFDDGRIEWTRHPQACDCEKSIQFRKAQRLALFDLKEKKARIDRNLRNSGLCKRSLDRVFSNFIVNSSNNEAYELATQYAKNFNTKILNFKGMQGTSDKLSLYIGGDIGVGKSHLAAAIGNYVLKEGIEVKFTSIGDLLLDVRKTYDTSSDSLFESEVLEGYTRCDLLILDDFGKEKLTDWGLAKLFDVINGRYKDYKPVVITSNYPLSSVLKRLIPANSKDSITGSAIVDRLYEMCVETFLTGLSYRRASARNNLGRSSYVH